jgi:predicted CXXCH cytochrome family protein
MGMSQRSKIILGVLVALLLSLHSSAKAQNKFNLKPGAERGVCLGCHPSIQEKLKDPYVHSALKFMGCTECHNPHTSNHKDLLDESLKKICFKCHGDIIPKNARSVHQVVAQGECVRCHDPHASKYKFHLLNIGSDLCFTCHQSMGTLVKKVKYKHPPVEDSCLNCHSPHASTQSDNLLKDSVIALCTTCHQTDTRLFANQHANYPVAKAKASCTSCHNPHGSDQRGMIYDHVHPPMASKVCNQCHESPTSPNPFKTRRFGFELCRACHSQMVNETLTKNWLHWPLVDTRGCLNCHRPHASSQKKLLSAGMIQLCGKCHSETIAKQERLSALAEQQKKADSKAVPERGAITHPPVQNGECQVCHSPHASNAFLLMTNPSVIDLCGTCHEWQKHSSHPIGEKVVDPRNKNLRVNCLSCHESHGTGYRYLNPFPTVTDLCVQCHKKFKR